MDSQERTLEVMWPFISPGGWYMIEHVEWDRKQLNMIYPLLHNRKKPVTGDVLQQNHAFFVDTSLGRRDWKAWAERHPEDADNASYRFHHTSNVMAIQKRRRQYHGHVDDDRDYDAERPRNDPLRWVGTAYVNHV